VFRRYERELTYTTMQYLDVLPTYSGHRALPARRGKGCCDAAAGWPTPATGGRVTKRYLTELRVARRLNPDPAAADR
jgi:hypothetical protein